MRVLDVIKWPFLALADQYAVRRRLSRFACGDCERHDQCGLPPNDLCIVRLARVESFGDRPRPRPVITLF